MSVTFICLYSAFCPREKVLQMSAISWGIATTLKLFSTPVTHREREWEGKSVLMLQEKPDKSEEGLDAEYIQAGWCQRRTRFFFPLGKWEWLLDSALFPDLVSNNFWEEWSQVSSTAHRGRAGVAPKHCLFLMWFCAHCPVKYPYIPVFNSHKSLFHPGHFCQLTVLWRTGSW